MWILQGCSIFVGYEANVVGVVIAGERGSNILVVLCEASQFTIARWGVVFVMMLPRCYCEWFNDDTTRMHKKSNHDEVLLVVVLFIIITSYCRGLPVHRTLVHWTMV